MIVAVVRDIASPLPLSCQSQLNSAPDHAFSFPSQLAVILNSFFNTIIRIVKVAVVRDIAPALFLVSINPAIDHTFSFNSYGLVKTNWRFEPTKQI
jgi:hypothetical protein